MCVCECELDATGVALSQIDKHNMRHHSMPIKRLVAEMRADGRDVSLHNTRWQCLKASSKEEQVGVTRCAKENEIN